MTVRIELFYSPACPLCPRARELVMSLDEDNNMQIEEVNILSNEGLKRAENYGVSSLPTIVLNGKTKLTGLPSRSNLMKMIQQESSTKQEEG